ncbi:hypothetical protein ABJY68_14705, partial [Vibrio parahaemolyticus]|uniref:hypothetical protein n=1 Tax=Vibrio parahaemolyticus TaxID=670 RepID=UPI0032AFF03A
TPDSYCQFPNAHNTCLSEENRSEWFVERLVAKMRLEKNIYINKPNESGTSEQWLTRNAAGR